MATDRGAVLTVRAAARGLVDFSLADNGDLNWWRKVNAITDELAKDDGRKLIERSYEFHLAMSSNSAMKPESFKESVEKALADFRDIANSYRPWEAVTAEGAAASGINALLQSYKETFGVDDLEDPEFLKKIEDGLEEWKRLRATRVEVESDEDRVSRRLAERDSAGRNRR